MWLAFGGHRTTSVIIQQVLLTKNIGNFSRGQRSFSSVFSVGPVSAITTVKYRNERRYNIQGSFKRNMSSRSRNCNGHSHSSLVIPNNLKLLVRSISPAASRTGSQSQSCGVHSRSDDGPYLPPLMEMPFPPRTWPRFLYSIRNWFFIYFVIRPYMDKDFDIQEFNRGAKQAVEFVSEKLVSGEYDDLEGVVEPEALSQMKTAVASFTVFQRNLLKVAVDDIFFSFPYQIGIMIPEPVRQEGDKILPQTRHVEITVVFHILRGFAEQAKVRGDAKTFQDFIKADDTKYNVMICNYRFFKDFTEGAKNPTWIINLVNHFLPADKNHYS